MSEYSKPIPQKQKPKFSVAITTPAYQKLVNNTLGDPNRAKRFVAAITSAVAVNPALQECDAGTILSGALLGESLNLSPSPQLGQYYLVPFNNKKTGIPQAQFILGYKGYLQLAMRSGQVKKINAIEIKEGELLKYDPLNEEIEVKLIEDWDERQKAVTIGYYAFFELSNGFRKSIYWSKKQMISHADKYSPAFSAEATTIKSNGKTIKKVSYMDFEAGNYTKDTEWLYSSFWYKNFDEMAKKTMFRQLISKGGCPMSTDMIMAYEKDTTVIAQDKDGDFITVDDAAEAQTPELTAADLVPETENVVEEVDLAEFK